MKPEELWRLIRNEAEVEAEREPFLADFLSTTILNHQQFSTAMANLLALKLSNEAMPEATLRKLIEEAYVADSTILEAASADLLAVLDRDPAILNKFNIMLYLKGFQSLQAYRVAHYFWQQKRHSLALYLQSRISVRLQVDIHPAARIGQGVMFDHATGIVIGETSVIENDVSILQNVTLGGTGKDTGNRHPKIREGVLIAAGAKIFGNIEVGVGAKIGGGSVVLEDIPAHTTAVGVPAKVVGSAGCEKPAFDMDQNIPHDG